MKKKSQMFLVRFINTIGPQSVYCKQWTFGPNELVCVTEKGEELCYTPIGAVNIQTVYDW